MVADSLQLDLIPLFAAAAAAPAAGTLPLRVSPSKTPVRVDSRRHQIAARNAAGAAAVAHPPVAMPVAGMAMPGSIPGPMVGAMLGAMPGAMPGAAPGLPAQVTPVGHTQLPPALLMAVAGLQMGYPAAYHHG